MRKLLSILAAVGLTATTATGVIACSGEGNRVDKTAIGTQKAILWELLNQSEVVLEKDTTDHDSSRASFLQAYSQGRELHRNQRASVDSIYEINKSLVTSINNWLANSSFADQDEIKRTIENLAKKADKEYVNAKFNDLNKRIKLVEDKTSDLSAADISAIKKELNSLQSVVAGDKKAVQRANNLDDKIVGLQRELAQNLQIRVLNLNSDAADYNVIDKIQTELKELSSVVDNENSGLKAVIETLKGNLDKLWAELAQKIDKEELKKQIDALRNEMDQLQGNDKQKASQIKVFANQVKNLVTLLENDTEFKEVIEGLNHQLFSLSDQAITAINQKLTNLANQTADLKIKDVRILQNDIETLKGALPASDEKTRELDSSLVKSMRDLTNLEVGISQQAAEKAAEEQIKNVEAKFSTLNENGKVSSSDLGYLQTWIDSLETLLGQEGVVNGLQLSLDQWKIEIEQLTKNFLATGGQVAIEEEFEQVSRNLEKLSSEPWNGTDFIALQNQLVILGQLVDQLKDDNLTAKLTTFQSQISMLAANEVFSLDSRLKRLEENLGDLTVQDVNQLKADLEALTKIVDKNNTDLLIKINGLITDLDQLRTLANQKADKEYVDEQFKVLEDKIADLNNRIDNLKSNDLKDLQAQLDELSDFVGKTGDQGLSQKLLGLSQEVRDLTTKTIVEINARLEKLENDFAGLNPQEIQDLKRNLRQLTDLVTGKGGLQDRLDALEKKIINGVGWNSGEVPRNGRNDNWDFLELRNFLSGKTTMWVFNFLATGQKGKECRHRIYNGTTLISKDMFRNKNEVMFNIGFTTWSDGAPINDRLRGWFKKRGNDLLVSLDSRGDSTARIYSTLKIAWSAVN